MSAPSYYDQVVAAAEFIRRKSPEVPTIAVVLGSGLGEFAAALSGGAGAASLEYTSIPNWPAAGVVGHEGRLVIGSAGDRRIAALAGRAHYYEGYGLATVTFAVRVLGLLGVKQLILTNAAGGVNKRFEPGTLMAIDDHLNLMGGNPLIGPNDERFGPRFPDMTEVYSARLRRIADESAAALDMVLAHGIYAACHGPSYETPAEVRYLRLIGADAVGMSTVPEVITAVHVGLPVFAMSVITDIGVREEDNVITHDDVLHAAKESEPKLRAIFRKLIEEL